MHSKLWIAIFLLWATGSAGQVYPGDANQSGRADQQDMLYIGYAYGAVGPARVQTGTAFVEMPIALDWAQAFPDGTGYAYADANGDGLVSITDMLTVVSNYGLVHSQPTEPDYPAADPFGDPRLSFTPDIAGGPITAGSALTFTISLDYPGIVAADINGLAFSVDFNKNYIQSINLAFDSNWLGGPSSSFRFQNIDPLQTDQLDLAVTRYGANGTMGGGIIGQLSIVIEDDLITFMQADSAAVTLSFSSIMLVNDSLELQPVNGDSISFTVYNPGFLLSRQREVKRNLLQCYPNPVAGRQLNITAGEPIEEARVFNLNGAELYRQRLPAAPSWALQLPGDWPAGYYLLRVLTEGGRINEQLLFIP
ncbi:MAG: T9SS type A sorting domain-containing protein [Phaeodactylibacter sp.]|nr:T9SS type A sorting domain-containing protein [Phaeodactylibacter sp.]MCB9303420.1 T9SS type A sorting domain-containing protein [Lewinellaceae bacterium]